MLKLIVFLVLSFVLSVQSDAAPSRIFKERTRGQQNTISKTNESSERESPVMGSVETLASLARVQKDQAETFHLWSNQFQAFKNNVIKFMDQTSDVLQKNDKRIKTLQRVVRKIDHDIDGLQQ
uniref:SXP/RAL-2 family protein Ani s 5-like cation-binding domain-containing protein n=1 Tax=Caenorhabditis japonica TaxID=281687 RepID=A0A8R1I492_CAEJA